MKSNSELRKAYINELIFIGYTSSEAVTTAHALYPEEEDYPEEDDPF